MEDKMLNKQNEDKEASSFSIKNEEMDSQNPKIGTSNQPTSWNFPDLKLIKSQDVELNQRTTLTGRLKNGFTGESEFAKNKKLITEVFRSFELRIDDIRVIPGPTVTLYVLTMGKNTRLTKVLCLEEDLTLSLAANGARIIVPSEEKDTVYVELSNENAEDVPLWEIISSKEFKESTKELPIALGKTFGNKNVIVDLGEIPNLLIAGASGQGKSTTLHDIIISLLYKKRPEELKFVLIDPKRVEFNVYGPIARYYLASLQDNVDCPIIKQAADALRTLEGICSLINERLNMLKDAGVRNIREYNDLFNLKNKEAVSYSPMPYIIVIIDEYRDLRISLGSAIEKPIVKLTQLGRAVGIHLIMSTQGTTTKVLTGIIKANILDRLSFRVGTRAESRIILDRKGAQSLKGHGDTLLLHDFTTTRVQCANIEPSDIERVANFISRQSYQCSQFIIPKPLLE